MQRGLMALKEHQWQRDQYALGVYHGETGHQGMYADQYYQQGYRRGQQRRPHKQLVEKLMNLRFGALSPSLLVQLQEQGIPVPRDIKSFQADSEAITRLNVRDLLSDSATNKARQRLIKRLSEAIKEHNPKLAGDGL